MVSGVRCMINSPSVKIVLSRAMVTGVIGGGIIALMPLVARDLLRGGAETYGVMVSAFGLGAVIGALNITQVRKPHDRGGSEPRLCSLHGRGSCRSGAEQSADSDGGRAGPWRGRCG